MVYAMLRSMKGASSQTQTQTLHLPHLDRSKPFKDWRAPAKAQSEETRGLEPQERTEIKETLKP